MIGIFDSGVGGLTILKGIHEVLPRQDILYFADSLHNPYGKKSLREIRELSLKNSNYLFSQGADLIVIACNTATVVAVDYLRDKLKKPFVGTEPAIKPGIFISSTGRIMVLTTEMTAMSGRFNSLVKKHSESKNILVVPCPKLVQIVERNEFETSKVDEVLIAHVASFVKEKGIDTIVLGCTHFGFLKPRISKIVGKRVRIIDSVDGVAKQTKRIVEKNSLPAERGEVVLETNANFNNFENIANKFLTFDFKLKKSGI